MKPVDQNSKEREFITNKNLSTLILISCIVLFAYVFSFLGCSRVYADTLTPAQIYKKISPAVVLIVASTNEGSGSSGTGSIISRDGFIITNAHVILNDRLNGVHKKITIYLKPDKVTGTIKKDLIHRYRAEVIEISERLDLALLQLINVTDPLPVIDLGDPDQVNIGDNVVAIGHPEQGGLWTLTTGAISSQIENFKGIEGKDVFQTEASFNKGNSGGPLINSNGFMVGVNTSIVRKNKEGLAITDINFALKSSVVKKWMARNNYHLAYGKVEKQAAPVIARAKPSEKLQRKLPVPRQDLIIEAPHKVKEVKPVTPQRPVKMESVIEYVIRDLEDMMDEMRSKIYK